MIVKNGFFAYYDKYSKKALYILVGREKTNICTQKSSVVR